MQHLLKARWALSIGFFSIVLVVIFGCNSKTGRQMIEQTQIENDLKVGQVLRLGNLIKASGGAVCVLYPYQPYVAQEVPQSARINAYLMASGYAADESHWALVVVDSEKVNLSRFNRSEKLDILARHEIQPEHKAKLAVGFNLVNCASIERAAITKIESQNRIFLIMGEMK